MYVLLWKKYLKLENVAEHSGTSKKTIIFLFLLRSLMDKPNGMKIGLKERKEVEETNTFIPNTIAFISIPINFMKCSSLSFIIGVGYRWHNVQPFLFLYSLVLSVFEPHVII